MAKDERRLLRDLREGERVSGWIVRCVVCGVLFVGRKGSRFCSGRCRQREWRKVTDSDG